MASREYSSTDTGAPQMGGNAAGSLVNIIKTVLVDGYGDKLPLGWELMFIDPSTYTYVFRPKTGSRMFLKLVDDGSATLKNGSYCYMKANSYENMFSAFMGIHPCPPEQEVNQGNSGYVLKTGVNNTTVQRWRIIGDDCGFYLITFPFSSQAAYENHGMVYYFGDYVCVGSDGAKNQYNWFMLTKSKANNARGFTYSNGQTCIMRNPYTNTKGSKYVYLLGTDSYVERSALNSSYAPFIDYLGAGCSGPSHINGLPVYSQVRIRAQEYNSYLLGSLPGLFDVITTAQVRKNQIYYDVLDESNKLVSIPIATVQFPVNNADHGRLAFLIGEKFRYVF